MKAATLILAFTALTVAPAALSQSPEEAEAAIGYRKAYMGSIGGHFGAIRRLVAGEVSHEGDLAMHANALAALSANLVKLFPEGSGTGETDAKAEIWEQWEDFTAAAEKAEEAGRALAVAVAGGDAEAIEGAARDLSQSCRGCHREFKVRR